MEAHKPIPSQWTYWPIYTNMYKSVPSRRSATTGRNGALPTGIYIQLQRMESEWIRGTSKIERIWDMPRMQGTVRWFKREGDRILSDTQCGYLKYGGKQVHRYMVGDIWDVVNWERFATYPANNNLYYSAYSNFNQAQAKCSLHCSTVRYNLYGKSWLGMRAVAPTSFSRCYS